MSEYDPAVYWQWRGKHYDGGFHDPATGEKDLDFLAEKIRLYQPAGMLDVGSGYGRVYLGLRKRGIEIPVAMCDIARSMAVECHRRTGMRPRLWDGMTLPYRDGEYDLVSAAAVLVHVRPEVLDRFIRELARVSSKLLYVSTGYTHRRGQVNDHCFGHDCQKAFLNCGLKILDELITEPGWLNWILSK